MAYAQKSMVEILYLVSKRNVAHYFRKEIERIANGESSIFVLSEGARKRLTSYDILDSRKGRSKVNPNVWELYDPDPELYATLADL